MISGRDSLARSRINLRGSNCRLTRRSNHTPGYWHLVRCPHQTSGWCRRIRTLAESEDRNPNGSCRSESGCSMGLKSTRLCQLNMMGGRIMFEHPLLWHSKHRTINHASWRWKVYKTSLPHSLMELNELWLLALTSSASMMHMDIFLHPFLSPVSNKRTD